MPYPLYFQFLLMLKMLKTILKARCMSRQNFQFFAISSERLRRPARKESKPFDGSVTFDLIDNYVFPTFFSFAEKNVNPHCKQTEPSHQE